MEDGTSEQLRPDAHAPTPVPAAPETPVGRPSWPRVLLVPWLSLVRPRSAGACLAAASRPAFVLLVALSLVGYAALVIGLMLWGETVTEVWSAPVPTTAPTTAAATNPAYWPTSEIRERTVGQVWRQWRATAIQGWIGPAEVTLALVVILGTALLLFLGWFNLPLVHSTGSVWRSYKRSFRASAAFLWPLTALTLACGGLFIAKEHANTGVPSSGRPLDDEDFWLLLSAAVSACVLAVWLQRATDAVTRDEPLAASAPRCEGCGYDLTHRPESGRCPECGLGIDASLVEEHSRPGSEWSHSKLAAGWLATSYEVLFQPGSFYRALKLRTPLAEDRGFGTWHYALLASVALLWAWAMTVLLWLRHGLVLQGQWPALALGNCAAVVYGVSGCWLGHRLFAAVVVSFWLARDALPDCRWARKVLEYETTFLWAFCCFWGALLPSFLLFDLWISGLINQGRPVFYLGPPLEAWALLAGTAVLAVLWLRRYQVAYRAIRWSNY